MQMTSRVEAMEVQSTLDEQWRALANVIDRLLFYVTLLILGAGILGMFIKTTQQPQRPSFNLHFDE